MKRTAQLNLEYAHRVFQLRATTLLIIPWGLKMPREAYSIVILCWGDWRKCSLEASNHPNPQPIKIIPHLWSSNQHQTGSPRMGEMSSTTHRKQDWKGATRASAVVNQELDKRKRTHWGAGRKKTISSSESWQWEPLIWLESLQAVSHLWFHMTLEQQKSQVCWPHQRKLCCSLSSSLHSSPLNIMTWWCDMWLTHLSECSVASNRTGGFVGQTSGFL